MPKLTVLCLIVLSSHALEPFQEQTPLSMTIPNAAKDQSVKWIPLETSTKNTLAPTKAIDESIKNQIQKKMQSLLTPLKDGDADQ
ncbi:MAG: hypothetical protein QG558_291 [Campylobacterota bacterium]|nr:hypothetical protein [Campylobacterota bacterium]